MSYTTAIINGIILGLFIAISVGPTLFAVIKHSMQHSFKAGLAFVVGVSISDILYVIVINLATNWLEYLEAHQKTVSYIGAGLFVLMGLIGFLKKYKPKRPPKTTNTITISKSLYASIALSGFMMNTLNPGVLLYWVGAATLVAGESYIIKFIIFGVCLGLVLGIDFLKVFLADIIRQKLTLRKIMYLNKTSSLIILSLGILLFLKTYFNIQL
jgi:threonine/homoserine/homoserine lactone efflux protein